MTQAIRFHTTGGPEVLRWDEVAVGAPGPGEALVRHTAIGLNFIDTYHRSGLYPVPLPSGLGMEAAGVVEEVGEGVSEVGVGQRVAYAGGPLGAYSEARLIPAHRLVPLPEGIDDRTAAAIMLKGMTAQYLLRSTFRVGPGHTVLIHAAAGGVGLIACQWARHLGATVIGTVSTRRQGGAGKCSWVPPRDRHGARGHRQSSQGDHRRRRRPRGVRLGGPRHLGRLARLSAAPGTDGLLRQRLGAGAADLSRWCCRARARCS